MPTDLSPPSGGSLPAAAETERARRHWRRHAPHYDASITIFEKVLFGGGRKWACSQATGHVLELAAGTGRNLPHYPVDVQLTVTDFSAEMLAFAGERASAARPDADVRLADAQALDFPEERFDTVVCTLGLCSIPDDARAVAEAARVLRPGGRLVLVEHVASPNRAVRAIQRLLDLPSTRFCADHLVREPLHHVRSAGLEVERLERSKLGIVERLVARKP